MTKQIEAMTTDQLLELQKKIAYANKCVSNSFLSQHNATLLKTAKFLQTINQELLKREVSITPQKINVHLQYQN